MSPLEFWDVDLLQEREAREIKSGGFGSGKLLGMSVSIVRKYEEIENSMLKIKKVEDMLAVCGSHKHYLAKTIGLLLLENPTNIEIKGFVSKFESLFQERPINLEENNVRGSKHEAECSKMMSGLNNTDINATIMDICMEVGRLAKTGENEEGDRLGEYNGGVIGEDLNNTNFVVKLSRQEISQTSFSIGQKCNVNNSDNVLTIEGREAPSMGGGLCVGGSSGNHGEAQAEGVKSPVESGGDGKAAVPVAVEKVRGVEQSPCMGMGVACVSEPSLGSQVQRNMGEAAPKVDRATVDIIGVSPVSISPSSIGPAQLDCSLPPNWTFNLDSFGLGSDSDVRSKKRRPKWGKNGQVGEEILSDEVPDSFEGLDKGGIDDEFVADWEEDDGIADSQSNSDGLKLGEEALELEAVVTEGIGGIIGLELNRFRGEVRASIAREEEMVRRQ
ncbi:hypothetical protein L1987_53329 [Smallanthus sonchifolius]|uniref:Uncharacterized protein n=1 Tax=Smallanthus sonchifolius TaxID=185202 RepID=A0ACB9EVK3_9ASTR|nr:hypothetical protein L1987_53329 [Smallanthus sonchifolius]